MDTCKMTVVKYEFEIVVVNSELAIVNVESLVKTAFTGYNVVACNIKLIESKSVSLVKNTQ